MHQSKWCVQHYMWMNCFCYSRCNFAFLFLGKLVRVPFVLLMFHHHKQYFSATKQQTEKIAVVNLAVEEKSQTSTKGHQGALKKTCTYYICCGFLFSFTADDKSEVLRLKPKKVKNKIRTLNKKLVSHLKSIY